MRWHTAAAIYLLVALAVAAPFLPLIPRVQAALDGVTQQAPVTSVNSAKGAVSVPYLQRAVGSASAASGSATIAYKDVYTGEPYVFNNVPTCMEELKSADTTYVFSKPTVASKSTSSITFSVSSAKKTLAISVGSLTLWATPPNDLVITVFCVAAP